MQSNGIFLKLLVGQMAMQGVSKGAIEFFKHSFDALLRDEGAECLEMSQIAFTTRQNANRHVLTLQQAGYLERNKRRSWRLLKKQCLKDQDFLALFDLANARESGNILML